MLERVKRKLHSKVFNILYRTEKSKAPSLAEQRNITELRS